MTKLLFRFTFKPIFKLTFLVALSLNLVLNLQAGVIYSKEIGGNSVSARNKVEILDATWKHSFLPQTTFDKHIFATNLTNINNFEIVFPKNTVTVGLYDYNFSSETLATKGFDIDSNTSFSMQDGAPFSSSLYKTLFVNEIVGNNNSLNAIKFSFKNPSFGFGAFFGDLETRNDGSGKPAKVILRFVDGTEASPVSILNYDFGGNLQDESLCGSPNINGIDFVGCGNQTTKWIGFESSEAVKEMLVIVGDDDYVGQVNGFGEHFSFVGPTIANLPKITISSVTSSVTSSIIFPITSSLSDSTNAIFTGNFSSSDTSFSNTSIFNLTNFTASKNSATSSSQISDSQNPTLEKIKNEKIIPILETEIVAEKPSEAKPTKPIMTIRTGGFSKNNYLLYIGFLILSLTLIKTLAV